MKKILFLAMVLLLILSGCRKAVEHALDDAIIKAMTDGQWVITSFKRNGNDITADFSPYRFQYYPNKTVVAIKAGIVDATGTWDGSAMDKTTWAEFPGNAMPVTLLNGQWLITNNTWTYVIASQTNGGETKTFRLDKK